MRLEGQEELYSRCLGSVKQRWDLRALQGVKMIVDGNGCEGRGVESSMTLRSFGLYD